MKELTINEIITLQLLKKVKGDNLWAAIIRVVVKQDDADKFRQLIEQLQSQAKDNPPIMKEILGVKIYKSVMDLKIKKEVMMK
jgi:hypothetical protein